MEPNLKVSLGKLKLANPVLAASGTFGYGFELKKLIDVNKLGGIITKTITSLPKIGNEPPRVCELYAGMLNSIGLENVGVERFIKEKLPELNSLKTSIIVSIAGDEPDEFAVLAEKLSGQKGIDALELNLSCPNIYDQNRVYCDDKESVKTTIEKVKQKTLLPLIVKLSSNASNFFELAKSCEEQKVDALTVANTYIGMAVNVKTKKPKLPFVTAGYSGPAIKPLTLRYVWLLKKKLDTAIVASGGIMNLQDALEYFITGATAVSLGTVNFINPNASSQILEELKRYMKQEKINKMEELIGSLIC